MTQKSITDQMDVFGDHFKEIHLQGQKISKAEFDDCTFIGCDLSETFFSFCKFTDCHFENCNLTLLKLANTKMSHVTFRSCKMIGIDWTKADWKTLLTPEPLEFYDSILDNSTFLGLHLDDVVMKECRIKEVDFRDASFQRAHFNESDFKGSLFHNTHLEGANFLGTKNTLIDPQFNHLKGAVFNPQEALFLLEAMGILIVNS